MQKSWEVIKYQQESEMSALSKYKYRIGIMNISKDSDKKNLKYFESFRMSNYNHKQGG